MAYVNIENEIFTGFLMSFLMILLTEIGDKTFFMTAIFVREYSRSAVAIGSSLALILMTVLSTTFGVVMYKYIPRLYMLYISATMFIWFSVSFFREYLKQSDDEMVELHDLEKGSGEANNHIRFYRDGMIRSFSAVFIAEWGDRSQISTITLASTYNLYGVVIGASLGHVICTLLAASIGHLLIAKISPKTIEVMAGILFSLFAVMNVLEIFF